MSGIGIITNPHSKLNKRNPHLIHQLRQQLRGHGALYVTQSLDELSKIPEKFLSSGHEVLAICGGDGTISRTISAFIRSYGPNQRLPPIVLLRGGTMNLIAREIGQKGSITQILDKLIQLQKQENKSPFRRLRCLEVQGSHGFLYADGSNVAILEEFYRKKTGVAGALWLATRLIASFLAKGSLVQSVIKTKKLQLQFDGHSLTNFYSLGNLAGTISKIPLGFPLLPYAKEDPNRFQVTLITCPQEKLLWHLPRIMLQQKKGQGFGKFSACCDEVVIQGPDAFRYTLDGEIYESSGSQLVIRCGPLVDFLQIKT